MSSQAVQRNRFQTPLYAQFTRPLTLHREHYPRFESHEKHTTRRGFPYVSFTTPYIHHFLMRVCRTALKEEKKRFTLNGFD